MSDFRDYNRVVLWCYPGNAGGNFLINCLSLDENCVLRDSQLAERQLKQKMTALDKFDYYLTKLDDSARHKQWNDLGLGCQNLFGVSNEMYLSDYPEILQRKFNSIVKQLIVENKFLFLVGHTTIYIELYLKFWRNARVVFITDYRDFVEKRIKHKNLEFNNNRASVIQRYWDIVRCDQWPHNAPTSYEQFLKLPTTIRSELENEFAGEIFRWYTDIQPTALDIHDNNVNLLWQQLGNRAHKFNLKKAFRSTQNLLTEIDSCSTWVGTDVSRYHDLITDYYAKWQYTILNYNL